MDVTPREKYYSKQGFIQIFLTVENTGNEWDAAYVSIKHSSPK